MVRVSWDDAKEYTAWLSKKIGKIYRLLSEAEWEYVARAGTTTQYSVGDTLTKQLAQFKDKKTTEVGSFKSNAFGVYDMHGNVWEWCEDNWHSDYKGAPQDGSPWPGGHSSSRVLRGGAWGDTPGDLRSANRSMFDSAYRLSDFGFRVARTL